MTDTTNVWIREDDPSETASIVSQERHPNGRVVIRILTPESAAGQQHSLPATEFYQNYYAPNRENPELPEVVRPTSFASAKQWRRWALHIEKQLEESRAELENARRSLVPHE